jgi:RNA polymerase sigma factor (sigma-70 family)
MMRAPTPQPDGTPPPAPARGEELDAAAFEQLFVACAADVHGYAISLLHDRAAAEDVTALAFERLYRSRHRLDRVRGTPRAWLFAIARNAALDELRRRRRHPSEPGDVESAGGLGGGGLGGGGLGGGGVDELDQVERRAALRPALLSLAPREREIVLLKFHGQLTNAELARVLGISESNAGTRLHRALLSLRDACAHGGRMEVA